MIGAIDGHAAKTMNSCPPSHFLVAEKRVLGSGRQKLRGIGRDRLLEIRRPPLHLKWNFAVNADFAETRRNKCSMAGATLWLRNDKKKKEHDGSHVTSAPRTTLKAGCDAPETTSRVPRGWRKIASENPMEAIRQTCHDERASTGATRQAPHGGRNAAGATWSARLVGVPRNENPSTHRFALPLTSSI